MGPLQVYEELGKRLTDRRQLLILGRRCGFFRNHRQVVSIHFGFFGFLFLALFFLQRPQLLAAFLEILSALCLLGRVDSRRQTFNRDACVHAVRIRVRLGGITVALQEHAIE